MLSPMVELATKDFVGALARPGAAVPDVAHDSGIRDDGSEVRSRVLAPRLEEKTLGFEGVHPPKP
jgi:hypothetical protein